MQQMVPSSGYYTRHLSLYILESTLLTLSIVDFWMIHRPWKTVYYGLFAISDFWVQVTDRTHQTN